MAGQSNAAPVIIKRKKIIAGGGHHGGAWKVAYADFVTAMMAFFLLMWLLNATTEKQRKGLADYFSPTIAVNRVSGGGDDVFGGDSMLSEEILLQNGLGASGREPTEEEQARGSETAEALAEQAQLAEVETKLLARTGESMTMERLLRHVVTRVTDEGLVIELFDLPGAPLFKADGSEPSDTLLALSALLADVLQATENPVALSGHSRSYPVIVRENPVWALSMARAQSLRKAMTADGFPEDRVARVTGHADRKTVALDSSSIRNNRLEVILLRMQR